VGFPTLPHVRLIVQSEKHFYLQRDCWAVERIIISLDSLFFFILDVTPSCCLAELAKPPPDYQI